MFCRTCGKKIKDDAAFCPFCGCATGLASTAAPAQASASEQTQASLEGQVSAARKRSRRRMPMVLIVILVVFGLATAAFAANYIYKTFIVPQMEAAAPDESVAVTEPSATTEAATTEPVEPEVTTYTTQGFTGDKYVGAPPEYEGVGSVPAFAFDLPSGWEVTSNDLNAGHLRILITNQTQGITLSLHVELGSGISGLVFDGNDLTMLANSNLGSEYSVGYYAKQSYSYWDGFFGLCQQGVGLPGVVFGDMDYTIYFSLSKVDSVDLTGDMFSDSSIGNFWASFNINDPKWADVISIISSLRYAN